MSFLGIIEDMVVQVDAPHLITLNPMSMQFMIT